MSATIILGIMDLTIAMMKAYPSAKQTYDEMRRDLEAMQREGRQPTPEDLDRYTQRINRARTELHTDR